MLALPSICLLFSLQPMEGPTRLPSFTNLYSKRTLCRTGYKRANQDVEQTFRALEREDRQQQDRISQPRSSAQRANLPKEHHKLSPCACMVNLSLVILELVWQLSRTRYMAACPQQPDQGCACIYPALNHAALQ